ncbi:WxL domain-containing protein [Erwinia sp. CPCC 100877]|nr:WxL domain-containing protein [Erwinia sp. CPCC 100877]
MKKVVLIAGLLVSTSVLGAQISLAVNTENATTNGTVTMEKPTAGDSETTDPVDPNNPDNPFVPENPNPGTPEEGTDGLITIDQAPDLDFGTLTLGKAQKAYAALQSGTSAGASTEVQNFVQVTDKSGNYAGWTLSVKRTEFVEGTDANKTLAGTTLRFKNASLATTTDNPTAAPSTFVGAGTAGVEIPVDSKIDLVKAGASEGIGTWIYKMGADAAEGEQSVELDIPLAQYTVGNYTSTLTWTITDAPQSN